ncbi:MAG: acyltransferase family protein [Verrucomicrobiota bacterium]
MRALAILPVMLFHAEFGCPGGFVGVDVFFVISGFLITSLILEEIHNDAFSLAMFWERRIRRILPALFVVVFATLIAACFLYFPDDFKLVGQSVLAQALLLSNVFFWRQTGYFADGVDTLPLLHTWSLAVEEQFYVLFPLLLIYLGRHKRFSIARTILWVGFGSFALSVVGTYSRPTATFYLLPTRAWELMVGAFLAAVPGRHVTKSWLNEMAAWSGLCLILFPIFYYTPDTRFPGLAAVPPCLGTALIIFSGGAKPTLISRVLALKPVAFIGLISYPLYLWHWPLLVFSRYRSVDLQSWWIRVALLLASVVCAAASWKWIETPFRKRRLCPRRSQLFSIAACAMLTLLLLGGCVFLDRGMPFRFPSQALAYYGYRKSYAFRASITVEQAAAGQFVELGAQSTNQPVEILIWGDSHAMSVAPVLDELCRRFSVRGVEAAHSSTAPILGYISNTSKFGLNEDSPAFSQSIVDFIAKKRVKTVILAALWSSYKPPDVVEAKLAATVQTIMASGASVYVLKDVPMPGFDVPRLAAFTVMRHGNPARLGTSLDKYAADNGAYESIFKHVSQIGAIVLDTPKYLLNTNGFYDVVRDNKALYFDSHHLSVDGSKLLSPMFEPVFHNQQQ